MMKNLIVLPDGTEIFSGTPGQAAIRSVEVTWQVNPDKELTPGGVCAAMLEASIFAPAGFSLSAGQEFTLFHVFDDGSREQVGIFLAEKPVRQSAHLYSLTAYDRVSKLDKDLSQWLYDLPGWPYALTDFVHMVCEICGVTLSAEEYPGGDYSVAAFSGQGITGRQLLRWAGQVMGRFCRATPEGVLEFAWYTPTDIAIGPWETADRHYYFQGGLTYEDYQVAPIEKVQIHLTDEDVGAVYPDDAEARNTLAITGNYLLTTSSASALEQVAQSLYEQLKDITYTPGSVSVSAAVGAMPGDIISVTDPTGKELVFYVMTRIQQGQKAILSCTGSPRRDSSSALNHIRYKALSGKVLNLRADVEGMKLENRDAAGNLAALTLTVDGIHSQVVKQEDNGSKLTERVSALEQTAESVELSIQTIQGSGVSRVTTTTGYTFNEEGLTIAKSGQEMENQLTNTGMYVKRSGETVLQANSSGVKAVDVTVENYLVLGSYARFEDYSDGTDTKRTACFWTS